MKKVFYSIAIFFVLILTFNSCLRESNTITLLDYISKEYIYNYLPYEEGQVLLFVNEDKSDSCTFITVEKEDSYRFLNDIGSFGSKSYGLNEISTFVCFENTDSLPFRYGFYLYVEHYANNPECTCYCGGHYSSNDFGKSYNISLEDIESFFTPVFMIYDCGNPTEEYVKIVNGFGIAWFRDYYGKKWYFDSVLPE